MHEGLGLERYCQVRKNTRGLAGHEAHAQAHAPPRTAIILGGSLADPAERSRSRARTTVLDKAHARVRAQVTSPIRRYADLVAHYQLNAQLRGEPLPFPPDDDGGNAMLVRLATEVGNVPRTLERQANDYWLREALKRRAGQNLDALVLGRDFRNQDVYKLLLTGLGAIVDCRASQPLTLGDELEVAPNRAGEFVL